MMRVLLAATTIAALVTPQALWAHGPTSQEETVFGRPGDPKKASRTIEVSMRDEVDGTMVFVPRRIAVRQGEQIRFRIKNEGIKVHEFVLATVEANLKHADEMKKNPEMEHDEPNMKRLRPDEKSEVVWRFTKPGKFHIACLIPGHLEAGMEAFVDVVPISGKAKSK